MKNDSLVIYLDQNQWIYLAQAYYNHPEGEKYKAVLERLQNLVSGRKVVLPLSAYHFLETQKIQNKERQERLAQVMSTLSRGWGMALLDLITPVEIKIAGAKLFNYPVPNRPQIFARDLSLILGIDLHAITNNIAEENNEPLAKTEEFAIFMREFLARKEMTKELLTGEIFGDSQFLKIVAEYKVGISRFAEGNRTVRSIVATTDKSQIGQKIKFISDSKEVY